MTQKVVFPFGIFALFASVVLLLLYATTPAAWKDMKIPPLPRSQEPGFIDKGMQLSPPGTGVGQQGFNVDGGVPLEEGYELAGGSIPNLPTQPSDTQVAQVLAHDLSGLTELRNELEVSVAAGGRNQYQDQLLLGAATRLDAQASAAVNKQGEFESTQTRYFLERKTVALYALKEIVDQEGGSFLSQNGREGLLYEAIKALNTEGGDEADYYSFVVMAVSLYGDTQDGSSESVAELIQALPEWQAAGVPGYVAFTSIYFMFDWTLDLEIISSRLIGQGYTIEK